MFLTGLFGQHENHCHQPVFSQIWLKPVRIWPQLCELWVHILFPNETTKTCLIIASASCCPWHFVKVYRSSLQKSTMCVIPARTFLTTLPKSDSCPIWSCVTALSSVTGCGYSLGIMFLKMYLELSEPISLKNITLPSFAPQSPSGLGTNIMVNSDVKSK